MGGPNATDDLREGHLTQTWLAASDDPEARSTGGYWHHRRRLDPHPTAGDEDFQDALLASLEESEDQGRRAAEGAQDDSGDDAEDPGSIPSSQPFSPDGR